MSEKRNTDAALVLTIGLVISSLILAWSLDDFARRDAVVEVKGFSEREVPANLAVWPINYSVAASTLDDLRNRLDRADEAVTAFLKLNGFADAEITPNPPRVTDRWLNAYESQRPADRYVAERTLTLRSNQVDAVRQAMASAAELLSQGVTLSPNWGNAADFMFTRLDQIKPDMIAEATADARGAADQFARDSGSQVGAIRRARQGYFTIDNLDPSSPHIKRVRVVTTIEYGLED